MTVFRTTSVKKLLLLLTVLAIVLSSLVACPRPDYVASSKDEITANITEDFSGNTPNYKYVYKYLREWGMPVFDTAKFDYYETVFTAVYNYGDGLPGTAEHARMTALEFLEVYYDGINKNDVTAVTDALLTCYASVLDDPYCVYRPPVEADDFMTDMSGKFGGIGVVVEYDYDAETIMVNTVYIGSPAEDAGIQVGDFIHAVNGDTVEELGLTNAVYYIRGEIGTNVTLTLIRNGEHIDVTVTRAEVEELSVDYAYLDEYGFGYVQIASFKKNTFDQFAEAIVALEEKGVRGYIFDLRGNLGGYLTSVCDTISYIIPTGKTIVTYKYKSALPKADVSKEDVYGGKKSDHTIDLPIVVLCDGYTASAGEIFTAAIRDYRNEGELNAKIVGTNTFGKGIMQNTYSYLGDGSTVTLTVAYYDPPCGVNYHGTGVAPDVVIELPEAEIDPETGKYLPIEDTQLGAAISELQNLIGAN